jgi:hypothetical protein
MEPPASHNSESQAGVRNPAHNVILLVQDQAVLRPIGNLASWQKRGAPKENGDRIGRNTEKSETRVMWT